MEPMPKYGFRLQGSQRMDVAEFTAFYEGRTLVQVKGNADERFFTLSHRLHQIIQCEELLVTRVFAFGRKVLSTRGRL